MSNLTTAWTRDLVKVMWRAVSGTVERSARQNWIETSGPLYTGYDKVLVQSVFYANYKPV